MRKMFPVVVAALKENILYLIPQYYFCNKIGLVSLLKHDKFVSSFLISPKTKQIQNGNLKVWLIPQQALVPFYLCVQFILFEGSPTF